MPYLHAIPLYIKTCFRKRNKGEKNMQYWHHKRGTNCTIISKIRSCNCHFSQGIKCKRLPNKHQNDIGYSSQYMNINNQHTTEKYYTLNLYLQENNNRPQPLIHTLIIKKIIFLRCKNSDLVFPFVLVARP